MDPYLTVADLQNRTRMYLLDTSNIVIIYFLPGVMEQMIAEFLTRSTSLHRSDLIIAVGLRIGDALISGQVMAELTLIDSHKHLTTPMRFTELSLKFFTMTAVTVYTVG